jgi:hypothetical protein
MLRDTLRARLARLAARTLTSRDAEGRDVAERRGREQAAR